MRLAIIGTGLIGASAGFAALRAGSDVIGWDEDPSALEVAAERGAVEPAVSLVEALRDADVALVAVPVASLSPVVREVLAGAPPACTVTDVGSTKGGVCAAAGDDARFVGGHPMAGRASRSPTRTRLRPRPVRSRS